jgi:hypothetical protein
LQGRAGSGLQVIEWRSDSLYGHCELQFLKWADGAALRQTVGSSTTPAAKNTGCHESCLEAAVGKL